MYFYDTRLVQNLWQLKALSMLNKSIRIKSKKIWSILSRVIWILFQIAEFRILGFSQLFLLKRNDRIIFWIFTILFSVYCSD